MPINTGNDIPSPFETLQGFLMNSYNRRVKESFREDIDIDNSLEWGQMSNEQKTLHQLLIRDNDNAGMMMLKMQAFFFMREELQAEMFGIPITTFQDTYTYEPQIQIYWKEIPERAQANNRHRIRRQLSFRIMQDIESITQNDLDRIVDKAVLEFKNLQLNTGAKSVSYLDKKGGIQISQFLVFDGNEGKQFIQKLCEVAMVTNPHATFKPENFKIHTTADESGYRKRETRRLLGETIELPKRRQVTVCKLHRIEFHSYPGYPKLLYGPKR